MRFFIGLVLGVALGSLGTYLGIARPWKSDETQAAADAGPAAVASPEGKKKKNRGGKRRAQGGAVDDEVETEPPPPDLSAADRETVSRGPRIQLPARSVDLGDSDSGRSLDSGEIDAALSGSSGPMQACVNRAIAGAELRGQATLEMLVGGDGNVQKVRVSAPRWLIDHGFAECATSAARRLRFPATGAPTIVEAPFHLD